MLNRAKSDGTCPSSTYSKKNTVVKVFLWMIGISASIYLLIYFIWGNGRFTDIFFNRCADFYMDFFNSIRDASQGSRVYSERGVIYPPMANLIFLIMSRFTPSSYNDTSFLDRYQWSEYFSAIMLAVLVILACAIALFSLIFKVFENGSITKRLLFSIAMLFSVPSLYLLERGNIIILSLLALIVYAFTYNSDSKIKRELGLLALAFAFSIKLYPVVFGWFLISDKRYKDAIRCAAYGLLMLLIPSFFFGGPIFCVQQVFNNIFKFSSGSGSTINVVMNWLQFPDGLQTALSVLMYLWVFICAACFAISPFIRSEKPWKTWIIGIATILCVPSLTSIYSWVFFIIPLIILANKSVHDKNDIVYTVFASIPFVFIPFRFTLHVAPTDILIYVMTAVISVFAVIDTLVDLNTFINAKKVKAPDN